MKHFVFLTLLFGAFSFASAQDAEPQKNLSQAEAARRATRDTADANRRFNAMRSISEYNRNITNTSRAAAIKNVANIYRKPSDKEMETLSVDKNDLKKYAAFLRQSETGLTRLISDRGCAESPDVVYVAEECRKYQMPGAGSSFSFREKNYRLRRLSDLTYDSGGFRSPGLLSHAILVNLGDAPLESVSLQTNGLKFLTEFETVTDFELAEQTDKKIVDGIESDGFFYSRSAAAKENSTYVLRVIAYRGNVYRAIEGLVYDELDFDERRDVTVAFRIVNLDKQGVTILWKILSNQKSPELKKSNRKNFRKAQGDFTDRTAKQD